MKPYMSVSEAIDDLPPLEAGEQSDVPDHNAMNHTDETVEKLDEIRYGQANHPAYARALPDDPAFTIVAGKSAAPVHHDQPRRLTVRETARVQSFPDSFELPVSTRKARYQLIGNAVPPTLAESIADVL